MNQVPITPSQLSSLGQIIGEQRMQELQSAAVDVSSLLSGRSVINVNSTAKGGGVAEMLQWLLSYIRGAGVDVNWYVISGTPEFYAITKRVHNMLHGHSGDGFGLTDADLGAYRKVAYENTEELRAVARSQDVIVLHDPQTAGLVPELKEFGATVIWRCHVGTENPSDLSNTAWEFLRPSLEGADAFVFSRKEYVPDWVPENRLRVIPPSIDPFATKNRPMSADAALAILAGTGILQNSNAFGSPQYTMADGSIGRVDRMADIVRTGPGPDADAKLVVQVSRWDRLKDMQGVMSAFADHVDGEKDSRLVLAGPSVTGVQDDPEGAEVLTECIAVWRELSHFERHRIQLVCLPMTDVDENAAIVNALQTHASVVVQKSLQEGFGLTVTEAMWKAKPVVASAVGGIQDQIVDGQSGLLVNDPGDASEFGSAVQSLLDSEQLANEIGINAKQRVQKKFLGDRHMLQYVDLIRDLLSGVD